MHGDRLTQANEQAYTGPMDRLTQALDGLTLDGYLSHRKIVTGIWTNLHKF